MSLQRLKEVIVRVLGRQRVNQIVSPYHDWQAQKRTSRRLMQLPSKDLCLNIGCGPQPVSDWINVDIARGPEIDVVCDVRKGLPFPSGSCSLIFCEHMIEHLSRSDAGAFLAECFRVLQPGGVIRLSTPDAERFLRSYSGDGELLRHPSFSEPIETPLDRINLMMRENGQHLWIYDRESLSLALHRAGFANVFEKKFGESTHPRLQNLDTPARAFESLYIEGVK